MSNANNSSHFDVSMTECFDIMEAIACEIDKHKNEPFHKPYLKRLEIIYKRLDAEIHRQDDGSGSG